MCTIEVLSLKIMSTSLVRHALDFVGSKVMISNLDNSLYSTSL